jgi:hypothetical protein
MAKSQYRIRTERYTQIGQVYLLPTVLLTHDKWLNGSYELILVWMKWGICFRTEEQI